MAPTGTTTTDTITATITVLGAPGTGKTQLSQALRAQLPQAIVWDAPPVLPAPAGLVLLMGLDALPAAQRARSDAIDARLRQALHQAQQSFAVLYGSLAQRQAQALRLLIPAPAADAQAASDRATASPPHAWHCEHCSDPDCERRLFTGLPGWPGTAARPA